MPHFDNRVEERFPKRHRLLKRREFLRVQQLGVKVHSRAFIGLVLFDRPLARIGITTTKRLGKAVERNRLRRLVREAFRRGRMEVPCETELVVIPKKIAVDMDGGAIIADLGLLAKRIHSLRKTSCDGSLSD